MSPNFDRALKDPPKGVQVWTACVEGQQSYEFEDFRVVNGLFMDALYEAADKGVQGIIQKEGQPFPLKQMVERVNARLREELDWPRAHSNKRERMRRKRVERANENARST